MPQDHTLCHRFVHRLSAWADRGPRLFPFGDVTTTVLDNTQDFTAGSFEPLIGAVEVRREWGHCCTQFLRLTRENLLVSPRIR
jgi:hypothetical protein